MVPSHPPATYSWPGREAAVGPSTARGRALATVQAVGEERSRISVVARSDVPFHPPVTSNTWVWRGVWGHHRVS